MDESRRTVLAAIAGLTGLAGCGDSGVSYPGDETTTATTDTTATSTPTEEPTTTDEPPTTTTPPVPALDRRTSAIAAEIDWFGSRYPPTLDRYHSLCDQAIATIEQVRRSSTLTDPQLQKVRTASRGAADFFDVELEPHFDVYGPVPGPHLEEISRFARRGDIDRAHEELAELLTHFKQVSSALFVNAELSRNPITDRLYDLLTVGSDPRLLVGFRQHTTRFEGWAYPRIPSDFSKLTYAGRNADHRTVTAPTTTPDRRTDLVSMTLNRVPASVRWERDSMPAVPLLLQQFESPDAARDAYEDVVETAVSVESNTTVGETTWDDVYYYHDGDIWYAYLRLVGSTVLTLAPSRTPWDERASTEAAILQRSWLWS